MKVSTPSVFVDTTLIIISTLYMYHLVTYLEYLADVPVSREHTLQNTTFDYILDET